jgi:hypothetical protein
MNLFGEPQFPFCCLCGSGMPIDRRRRQAIAAVATGWCEHNALASQWRPPTLLHSPPIEQGCFWLLIPISSLPFLPFPISHFLPGLPFQFIPHTLPPALLCNSPARLSFRVCSLFSRRRPRFGRLFLRQSDFFVTLALQLAFFGDASRTRLFQTFIFFWHPLGVANLIR